ncbi:hypothetical protein ABT116_40275 [Streptomyces sp. NPDC002130]|uniref:hypothetical protein n=1 Tax=Streptomyces sp. NPDC002130 TaxID=3155568 RepID=UPI003330AE7D
MGVVEAVGQVRTVGDGCCGAVEVAGDPQEQRAWGRDDGVVRVGGDHAESREQGQAGDSFFVVEVDVCDFQGFGQRRGGQPDSGDRHGDGALEFDQIGAGGLVGEGHREGLREREETFVGEVSLCGLACDPHESCVFGDFVVEDIPGFGVGDREPEIEEGGPEFGGSGVEPGGPRTHRCSREVEAVVVEVSLDPPHIARTKWPPKHAGWLQVSEIVCATFPFRTISVRGGDG